MVVIAAIAFGAFLLGFAYLAYDRFSSGRARFGTIGYEVVDAASVKIRFEVRKGVLESVVCQLRALDTFKNVVGTEQVEIGPADREIVVTVRTVMTTSLAASAEVTGCVPVRPTPDPASP